MTIFHISTVGSSFPSHYPSGTFPYIPFHRTAIQYHYTLWLYIAYGSAKEWLT